MGPSDEPALMDNLINVIHKKSLREVAENNQLLEVGRKAIEDVLIEFRDEHISELCRNNGLVCKNYDGTPSHIIRFGPETALRIGMKAIADHLEKNQIKDL